MSKLNKKGFMLAEVVVVSVVIATTLVTLYIGLNKVSSAYEIRDRYHDIDALYYAIAVNDYLVSENINVDNFSNNAYQIKIDNVPINADIYKELFSYEGTAKNVHAFYVKNFSELETKIDDPVNKYKQTFIDYVEYLKENIDFNDTDVKYIVVELCKKDNDDCYYYALNLEDGDTNE